VKLACLALLALAAACSSPPVVSAPAPALDPTRMSHAKHAAIACVECHRGEARPGTDNHHPCDDERCHRREFLAAPGPLCKSCHTQITTQPLAAPLRPFPADDAWQAEPTRFSHAAHMNASHMEGAVGFHVACADCHTRGDGVLARPDHATCARCHAPEVALANVPAMTDCAACHAPDAQLRARPRLIHDDLHFDHATHRTDRKGQPIRCEQCHADSARATSYADHAPPRVESCVACHDDSDRTPQTMRMRECQTCHATKTSRLTSLAPRNHLPATERPLDHTLAFRRDHSEAAERDAVRCATCHTQMSGNPRQACDECHQTMRPADHRVTWRELDHGTEAAADSTRCARCHVVDYCVACHAQRPRSHGFDYTRDHAPAARMNVRACLTCHVESSCTQCHATPSARGGR
jgi:hypothetical protein